MGYSLPPPLAGTKHPCLVVVSGFGIGRVVPLKANTTIGRAPENDLVLPYPTVSWNHAVVSWRSGVVAIRDLGSRNGTLIGVEKVKHRELVEGDVMALGDTMVLKLVYLGPADLARAPVVSGNEPDRSTGTANVAALLDRLRIEQSFTHDNDLPLVLTFFRVDGLEGFDTDTMMEKAMRRTARAIQQAMRCEAVLARSGHGEFIALSRTVPSLAHEMANRARLGMSDIAGRFPWRRSPSCTLAAAVVPMAAGPALTPEALLTAARAKAQGALSGAVNEIIVLQMAGAEDEPPG